MPIIRDSPVYPVIYDANKVILSLPPIINGDHSKITLQTKNVFIECTATDLTKVFDAVNVFLKYKLNKFSNYLQAKVVLDTMVCMFSTYCAKQFTVEWCEIVTPNGDVLKYPDLSYRNEKIKVSTTNSYIGIEYDFKCFVVIF